MLTRETLGRALAILPREFAAEGYVDMEVDDHEREGFMATLQKKINDVSIRVGTK